MPPHNLAAIKPGHGDATAGAALATGCPARRDRMSSLRAWAENPALGDAITAGQQAEALCGSRHQFAGQSRPLGVGSIFTRARDGRTT